MSRADGPPPPAVEPEIHATEPPIEEPDAGDDNNNNNVVLITNPWRSLTTRDGQPA